MTPLDKRRIFGPFYASMVKARHSYPMRMGSALATLPSQHRRAQSNPQAFAVDIEGIMGMGAVLAFALRLYSYAELQGLRPRIISTNPLYSPARGVDCLAPYVGAEHDLASSPSPLRFRNFESLFYLDIPRRISLHRANTLFWRYLAPRSNINGLVSSALAGLPAGSFDLSIHYRGTDKFLEAQTASLLSVEEAVDRHLEAGGSLRRVFLATDDPAFEQFAVRRWSKTGFTTFNLGGPSEPGMPRHFSSMPPEDKAVEAFVNMLLLARAPTCIRTSSYMSALSKIINPALKTLTLNRTFDGSSAFPEHEILATEAAT